MEKLKNQPEMKKKSVKNLFTKDHIRTTHLLRRLRTNPQRILDFNFIYNILSCCQENVCFFTLIKFVVDADE